MENESERNAKFDRFFARVKTMRRYDITAVVYCAAVLTVALITGHFHEVGNFGVETDFYGAYAPQAENIMAGQPYTYRENPPGYMLLLVGVSLLTGDFFTAGKVISAFAASFLGCITYLLFKSLFDSRIALASTILLVTATIPYSFLAATDLVGAVLVLLPLCVLLRCPAPKLTLYFVTGMLAGVAYLVRYNTVFIIPGVILSLVVINVHQKTLSQRLINAGLFLCGTLLIISPWLMINWHIYGSPLASANYMQVAAHFYYPTGDLLGTALTQAASRFDSLVDVLLYDPLTVLTKYTKNVFYRNIMSLVVEGLQFPAYLFAGAGLLLLLRDLCRRRLVFLIVCLLGYLLLGLVGFYLRYYFFLLPFLFLLVAYFLFQKDVFNALGCIPAFRIPVSWLIVIILAIFVSKDAYDATRRTLASEPRYLTEIAAFLRNRSSSDDLVIVRKPHLAYLSGLREEFPLLETPNEYLTKAREIGARYIVYSKREELYWPGLRSFGHPDTLPADFKLIYRHEPTGTLIYEIEK